jgi:hypothetical protein
LRHPITGIADSCARAVSGQMVGEAAALPSPAMNSRRRIRNSLKLQMRIAYRGRGCMGTGELGIVCALEEQMS